MTELQFRQALRQAMKEEYKWVPDPENLQYDYTFSEEFENKMRELTENFGSRPEEKAHIKVAGIRTGTGRVWIRRWAVVILVAVLMLALAACAIYFGISWSEKQNHEAGTLDVSFDVGNLGNAAEAFMQKRPKTPEGFEIVKEIKYSDIFKIEYLNDEEKGISYVQEGGIDTMTLSIDNDDVSFTEITVNGYKGYARTEGAEPYIVWNDGMYLYYLSGSVSFDLLNEMAMTIS